MKDEAEQKAEQVVEQVASELPEVWLGARQRHVLTKAIAAALKAERDAALKTCDELRDIRNLLVRSLVKATGETEEAVQEAPFGVACRHAEIDKAKKG